MKKLVVAAIILVLSSAFFAEVRAAERPHWSLELKGGRVDRDIEDWSTFYEDSNEYGGSLAYKVLRQVEIGIEGLSSRSKGLGFAPIHNEAAGSVKFTVAPLNVFLLLRGIFSENQLIVPYAGGGWNRVFYKQEIEYQGVSRGHVDGLHGRGGLQLLLDNLDPTAARNLYHDYGIHNTFFFIEGRYTSAMIETLDRPVRKVNLGGTSWMAGLLFEF